MHRDIPKTVKGFEKTWSEACSEAFAGLPARKRVKPKSRLHHYTTSEGLLGILQTQRLHASHLGFLADAGEIAYGRRMLEEIFKKEATDLGKEDAPWLMNSAFFFSQIYGAMPPPVFVAAFSEVADDVTQWDRYASEGRGYCLAFDPTKLAFALPESKPNSADDIARLRPVTYTPRQQRMELQAVVRKGVQLIEQFGWAPSKGVRTRQRLQLAHHMSFHILDLLSTFKDPGFKAEREWRLVYIPDPRFKRLPLGFRSSERGMVPYVPLQSANPGEEHLPLEKVTAGPRLSKEALLGLDYLLHANGYFGHRGKPYPGFEDRMRPRVHISESKMRMR